jgi:hypothetical protein
MHDLDRALQELESGADTMGSDEFAQQGETESDYEGESYEAESEYEGEGYEGEADYEAGAEAEYDGEGEYEASGVYEAEAEYEGEHEGAPRGDDEAVFDEIEEMEQAAALLEVQDEAELDQFLGSLFSKVKKKLKTILPPSVQNALAASLKKVAGAALPKLGAAVGNFVVPGLGGAIGAGIGANAGKMFGLELEGMSHEDQEFEVAKRVVGLGVEAVKAASQVAPGRVNGSPTQAAKDAVLQAAYTHAPGLASVAAGTTNQPVRPRMPRYGGGGGRQRSGRWFRRGHRIILLGI